MNKKGYILMGIGILFIILGGLFINSDFFKYSLFLLPVGVVFVIVGLLSLRSKNPEKKYDSIVNEILNTYDSILVKSSSVPSFENRNVIEVLSFDDLIDAQLELRKPICYMKQTESCSFILLDDKEAYVYVEKLNDQVVSPVEIEIKEMKIKRKNEEDVDAEMLRNIEKTTVVKLSNKKSYKVSPIRKKDKEEEEEKEQPKEKEESVVEEEPRVEVQDTEPAEEQEKQEVVPEKETKVEEDVEVLGNTRKINQKEIQEAMEDDVEILGNTQKIDQKELEKAVEDEIEYL